MEKVAREALDEFLERMKPRLRRVISHYNVPDQDVEDVVQQTMLTYLYKHGTVRDAENWLVGVARKKCLMYFRSHRRRLYDSVDMSLLDLVPTPQRPGQESTEIMCDLERAMARISPRCRSVLRLRYGLGYNPAEVAERLGYRPSGIRTITSRCVAALTQELTGRGFPKRRGR